MIWVEILSRHREIAARFRIAAPEARIGRGYDNDVIVDDPYVAAQHLRVFRDEAGQLVAEDLGSANGTFLDGGRNRLARIVIDGKHPIRIGQTYLRIREIHHEVERERVAPPEWRALPIAAAATLGVSLLGIERASDLARPDGRDPGFELSHAAAGDRRHGPGVGRHMGAAVANIFRPARTSCAIC